MSDNGLAKRLKQLTYVEAMAARALLDHIESGAAKEEGDWFLLQQTAVADAGAMSRGSVYFATRLLAAAGCIDTHPRGRHGSAIRLLVPADAIREALGDG